MLDILCLGCFWMLGFGVFIIVKIMCLVALLLDNPLPNECIV